MKNPGGGSKGNLKLTPEKVAFYVQNFETKETTKSLEYTCMTFTYGICNKLIDVVKKMNHIKHQLVDDKLYWETIDPSQFQFSSI